MLPPPQTESQVAALMEWLCNTCLERLGVTGAGVMLIGHGEHQGSVCGTDDAIRVIEEAQSTTGTGPCVEAWRDGEPVLIPDLEAETPGRWPEVSNRALAAGVRAMFALPLRADDETIGALDLYRDQPGALSDDELSDAQRLAEVAAWTVLGTQVSAEQDGLHEQVADVPPHRAAIEQAKGMAAAQLGISIPAALTRLRAAAVERGQSLAQVCDDLLTGRLQLS